MPGRSTYLPVTDHDVDAGLGHPRHRSVPPLPGYPLGYRGRMAPHDHGKAVLDDLSPLGRQLRRSIPDVYGGFQALHAAALAAGALDVKTKELIALAIAVSHRCDGCIASHARGAARAGATRQEAAEAIGVAIFMNGGPGTVYGPRAFDAFCEFTPEQESAG